MDNDNNLKNEKRSYFIGMIILVVALFLSLCFAKMTEGQRFLYNVLELFKYHASRETIFYISVVIIVVLLILYKLHNSLLEKAKTLRKNNKFLRFLPLLLILVALVTHFNFKHIQTYILSYHNDLDAVLNLNRFYRNIWYDFEDETGNFINPGYGLSFANCSDKKIEIHVKFIDKDNPENEYIWRKKDGSPAKITLYPRDMTPIPFMVLIKEFDSTYVEQPGEEVPQYYVVIYNDNDSKTFDTYFK